MMRRWADEAEARLHAVDEHGNNITVTRAQQKRRGEAVARGKAKKSGSPVAIVIAVSRWKNQTRYASERLRTTQSSLSKYVSGVLECPPEVADKVRDDFGLGDDVWPRPPRR